MKAFFAAVPLLAILLMGCPEPPPPVPPPLPDSSDAALGVPDVASQPVPGSNACDVACMNMQQRGCREGFSPYCPGVMSKIEADRLIAPTMCQAATGCAMTCTWCSTAKTPAEVVAKCASSCTPQ